MLPNPPFARHLLSLLLATLCTTSLSGCNSSSSDSDSVPLTNQPPRADAGADQTLYVKPEGQSFELKGSGSDSDGTIQIYEWALVSGNGGVPDPANAATTTVMLPSVTQEERIVYRLTVTDNSGNTSSDTITLALRPTDPSNQPPVAHAGTDKQVGKNSLVTLYGSGTDPDGQIIAYHWSQSGGQSVALKHDNQSIAQFIPPAVTETTDFTFDLIVTDDQNQVSEADQVLVTVVPINNSPIVTAESNPSPIRTGGIVTLTGSANDPDSDAITLYEWSLVSCAPEATAPAIQGSNQVEAEFIAPTVTTTTLCTFKLAVTDNGTPNTTSEDSVVVTITPNIAPTVNAGSQQTIASGSQVTLSGSATDSDGMIQSYQWSQTSPTTPTAAPSPNTSATTTVLIPKVATTTTFVYELTATDNDGATAKSSVNIIAQASVNQPPTADGGEEQTVKPEDIVKLDGSKSSDPDGNPLTYSWTLSSNTDPNVAINLLQSDTATPLFIAPTVTAKTILIFKLKVTDNGDPALSSESSVVIIIEP